MKTPTRKHLLDSIKDMEDVVNDPGTSEDIKDSIRPSITEAKRLLSQLDAAEKTEASSSARVKAVQKKAAKVKPVVKSAAAKSTPKKKAAPAPQAKSKPVKVARIAHNKSKKKISEIKGSVKNLLASLSAKVKSFNSGRSADEIKHDAVVKAGNPGKRKTGHGTIYYESRPNRSDISRRKRPYLAYGGDVSGGYNCYLIVDLDERGEYAATVYDDNDNQVWDCDTEAVDTLIEMGFLKYKPDQDLGGLTKYLVQIGVIDKGTEVLSESDFNADEPNDDDDGEDEYARGGLFQAPPQGENYTWQADKVNTGAAKHVGWRYTDAGAAKLGVAASKVPTQADIEKYSGRSFKKNGETHRYVYYERRKDKSDISRANKLAGGGQTAPQGNNWTWQADKVNSAAAKHVGWRYTDEGAARLGVASHKAPTQAHIDKYSGTKFRAKGETHRYLYQETRKDKSDINQRKHLAMGGGVGDYVGKGENIDVYGYQTAHFVNSPKAVEQFKDAMDSIDAYTENGMREGLAQMAEKVDTFLGLEAFYSYKTIKQDSFERMSQLLVQIGIYNYKSGLNINTEFLGEHLYNFCCNVKKKFSSGGELGGGLYDIVDSDNEIIEAGLTEQGVIDWAQNLQWFELMDIKEDENIPEVDNFEEAKRGIEFEGNAKVVPAGSVEASASAATLFGDGGTVKGGVSERQYEQIAHLWKTGHIDIEDGKWGNTGKYEGAVNNSSGRYYTNKSADALAEAANDNGVTLEDVKENNPSFTAFDYYKKKRNRIGESYAKGGSIFGAATLNSRAFNYDNPRAEKTIGGVNYRVAQGLENDGEGAWVLYKDGEIAGNYESVDAAIAAAPAGPADPAKPLKYKTREQKEKFVKKRGSIVTFITPFRWMGGEYKQILVKGHEKSKQGHVKLVGQSRDTPWFNSMDELIEAVDWPWMESAHD